MDKLGRVLLVNIGTNKTGVGNYASLLANYGKLQYDILNISLFKKGFPEDYPKSKNGKTFFYGMKSDNVLRNYISNYFFLNKKTFLRFLSDIDEVYASIFLDQQDLAILADTFHLKFKCNVNITVHDLGHFKHAPLHPYRFFLVKNFKALKSKSIQTIMCDSNITTRELSCKYPEISDKVKTVELSVDQNRYFIRDKKEARKKLNLPIDKILILNVGKDGYVKNVKNFINSVRYIKNDQIIYIRVGKLTYCVNDYDDLPISMKEKIIIRDNVDDDDLPLYYSASDIFVFPSLKEGFGLELVEAQLSGNVIITTDKEPMNQLIISKASLLIKNPNDPVEIATLIDEVSTKYYYMNKELKNEYDVYKDRFSMWRFIKETEDVLFSDA